MYSVASDQTILNLSIFKKKISLKRNWNDHALRRNCLLKYIIKGKVQGRIEVTGRWGGRRKQLLDDFKEIREYRKLKEEALDLTVCRTGFGRGCGPAVRQTTELHLHKQQSSLTKKIKKISIYIRLTIFFLPSQ